MDAGILSGKIKYLLYFFFFVLVCSGCGKEQSSNKEQKNDKLTIDILSDELIFWEPAIQEFHQRYPDVTVEIFQYSSEEMAETASKREAELMTGEGKDIYLSIESSGFDFYKAQQSGVFADLYPFFMSMDDFREEDYITGAFDLFENEDSCYIFPANFIASAYVTTEEIDSELPVSLKEIQNYRDFVQDKKYFSEKYPGKKVIPSANDTGEYNALWGVGIQDGLESFQKLFHSEMWNEEQFLFRQRLGLGDEEIPCDWEYMEEFQKNLNPYMEQKEYMCLDANIDLAFQFYCLLGGKEHAVMAQIPDINGNILVYPTSCVAISQSSSNQENAFRLLQIMLEEKFQKAYGGSVVKEYITGQKWIDEYGKEQVLIDGEVYPGVDEDMIHEIENRLKEAKMATGLLTETRQKYRSCMSPYYSGEAALDECAGEFLKFLEIYYTE